MLNLINDTGLVEGGLVTEVTKKLNFPEKSPVSNPPVILSNPSYLQLISEPTPLIPEHFLISTFKLSGNSTSI
jgi:hypothetical protein